jgi:predicted ATP-dependent serine protease
MSVSRLACDMIPEEQRFLWHDRIPVGHITVICGAPAKGKSTLGYRIAADADVPTVFITTEESDTTVWRPRIEAAGANLIQVAHHPEIKFSKRPEDLPSLAEIVDRYKAQLVVVDPLANHLRGASIHRDEQVRAPSRSPKDTTTSSL